MKRVREELLGHHLVLEYDERDRLLRVSDRDGEGTAFLELEPAEARGRSKVDDRYEKGVHRQWEGDDDHGDWKEKRISYAQFVATMLKRIRRWLVQATKPRKPDDYRAVFDYIRQHDLFESNVYGSRVEDVVFHVAEEIDEAAGVRFLREGNRVERYADELCKLAKKPAHAATIARHLAEQASKPGSLVALWVERVVAGNHYERSELAGALFSARNLREPAARGLSRMWLQAIVRSTGKDKKAAYKRGKEDAELLGGIAGELRAIYLEEAAKLSAPGLQALVAELGTLHGVAGGREALQKLAHGKAPSIAALNNEARSLLLDGQLDEAQKQIERAKKAIAASSAEPRERDIDLYFHLVNQATLSYRRARYAEGLPIAERAYGLEQKIAEAAAFDGDGCRIYPPEACFSGGAWAYFSTLARTPKGRRAQQAFESFLAESPKVRARLDGNRLAGEQALTAGLCIFLDHFTPSLAKRLEVVLAKLHEYVEKPTDTNLLYNFACSYARLDRAEPALKWLEKAFEAGFNKAHAKRDPDLESLRQLPQFARLTR
jgi:hypothetical protein